MLRRKEVYTNITPIPHHVPRQLAIDILHSHGEIITLNPLVVEHHPIQAPRDAKADEYYSTWYEITERIQYIPGVGKMGSGKITFRGCFHDMPWGLQTHIYAPLNVDLRNNWRIAGNQPGELPEPQELGIGAPPDGLYLREDIEIKCNITMVSLVKSQLKAASKVMVDRIIKKAELLDAGVLHSMMENGKLKTINPADRSNTMRLPPQSQSPPLSPRPPYQIAPSPTFPYRPASAGDQGGYAPPPPYGQGPASAVVGDQKGYASPPHYGQGPASAVIGDQKGYASPPHYGQGPVIAATGDQKGYASPPHPGQGPASAVMELPGDFYHTTASYKPSPLQPSHSSHTTGGFAVELPTTEDTREERGRSQDVAMKRL